MDIVAIAMFRCKYLSHTSDLPNKITSSIYYWGQSRPLPWLRGHCSTGTLDFHILANDLRHISDQLGHGEP